MRKRLKVLWITAECSLQDEPDNAGFTSRHERIMACYCRDRVELSVAYMADGKYPDVFSRGGITYYAVHADMNLGKIGQEWEMARAALLHVIEDCGPDVIQCFGSEWPYGAIAEDVDIPVVIHMLGFLNIYFPSVDMAMGRDVSREQNNSRPLSLLRRILRRGKARGQAPRIEDVLSEAERKIMSVNRYFLGRTGWDRNIVSYYSPGSKYYHVEEAIKQQIYDAAGQWRCHAGKKLRLFTLSSADARKGNAILLQTARILMDLMGLDIEWRVAGHTEFMPGFENSTGIRHKDVNIELLGMIDNPQIIAELKAADFFIHPSIMDNSPHSVCEAQLVGCPVIASNVGGVSDLVENGVTGFLYPYNEPHTLAFLIGNLRGNEDLLDRISANEVREALRRHDPGDIANTLADTYEEIIKDYRDGQNTS